MEPYTTLSETINDLRKQGYTEDFNLRTDCLECQGGKFRLFTNEFKIDKYYRFEGESNPSDNAILYAISSDHYALKGVLVNGYGIYSDELTDEMTKKLQIR